jgi:hypothetical protein
MSYVKAGSPDSGIHDSKKEDETQVRKNGERERQTDRHR